MRVLYSRLSIKGVKVPIAPNVPKFPFIFCFWEVPKCHIWHFLFFRGQRAIWGTFCFWQIPKCHMCWEVPKCHISHIWGTCSTVMHVRNLLTGVAVYLHSILKGTPTCTCNLRDLRSQLKESGCVQAQGCFFQYGLNSQGEGVQIWYTSTCSRLCSAKDGGGVSLFVGPEWLMVKNGLNS